MLGVFSNMSSDNSDDDYYVTEARGTLYFLEIGLRWSSKQQAVLPHV